MFYVLKENKKIIGTLGIINKGNNIAELKRMYLDKKYQGMGLGKKLLEKAVIFCKKNGFSMLEFETNKKFKTAHIFYLNQGFKIVNEDDNSYYMEKEI